MINYREQYINALLSNFSYLNFKNNSKNFIGKDLTDSLEDIKSLYMEYLEDDSKGYLLENFSYSLYFFVQNFRVFKQEITTGYNGFSATAFKLTKDMPGTNYKSGQIFVSYRGTEVTFGDLVTDFFLTFSSKYKFSSSQESYALTFLEEIIKGEAESENTPKTKQTVFVTGHSLGGYLAVRSVHSLSNEDLKYVKGVSTFNAAGFTRLDGGLTKDSHYNEVVSKVSNFYSCRSINVTSSDYSDFFGQTYITVFDRLGPRFGISTENESMMGNHGIIHLVNTMGFFSILDNIVVNLNDNTNIDYANVGDENSRKEARKIYSLNRIMMQAVAEEKDFSLMLDTLAWKIMILFGLEKMNLGIDDANGYKARISQFLSLGDFFRESQDYKLKIIDTATNKISHVDNNTNRALLYSLLEDISYFAIVPETFNTGIFDKTSPLNDLYDVTKYSQEYIDYRTIYNNIYASVLEKKVLNNLPDVFEEEILNTSLYSKFAFIDQENANSSDDSKIIYVNTNEKEYKEDVSGKIKIIYFKRHNYEVFKINKNNALIFDTPLTDKFIISGNNGLIKPSTGINNINIDRNAQNAVIEINSDLDQVDLYNNSFDYFATLKFPYKTSNQIKLVNAASKEGPINIILKFISENGIFSTCVGTVNLELSDLSITHKEIINLISIFPEVFNTRTGSSLKFDQSFIDNYTEATRYKFKSIGMTSYSQGSKISKEHAEYVNNKVEEYKKSIGVL